MHSPETVAFEIKNPFIRKRKNEYVPSIITIWHNDPEKDGTDDSCGWFKRARHGDKKVHDEIKRWFANSFNDWFHEDDGMPKFSAIATVMNMYQRAAWCMLGESWKKSHKFLRRHQHKIILFAENPTDSLRPMLFEQYGKNTIEYRVNEFASIIYGDILRMDRKWYQHPRWHIHHWSIQFHPLQNFKRRYWDKCCECGKRGFKSAPMSDWYGTKRWHQECDKTMKAPIKVTPNNGI